MDHRFDDYMEDYYNQDDEYGQGGSAAAAGAGGNGQGGFDHGQADAHNNRSNGAPAENGNGGNGSSPSGHERRHSGGGKGPKRVVGIVAAALLFGVVAGGTMSAVDMAANRLAGSESVSQTETIASSETQASQEAGTAGGSGNSDAPAVIGNDVSSIVKAAMPSVVAIDNKMVYETNNYFFGPQTYEGDASGSGIIVGQNDTELLVVTNNHVVEDSTELKVTFIDGTSVDAAIKGTDSESDLAVVAVPLTSIPAETLNQIKIATLGNSDDLQVGQGVVAIGNALGYGQAVTVGYVSALNREVTTDGVTRTLLQTDAAINPGNSGGALLNMKGEVIGINAAKYSSTEVEGMGYAIPISFAQNIIKDLMTKSTRVAVPEDEQGYLGIQLQNIDSRMSEAFGMPQGIYVYKILPGGAASKSDLKERDIITKFDGQTVKTGDDLQEMLTYYKGGTTVTLTVQSLEDGAYKERTVEVTLGYRKDNVNTQNGQNSQDGQNGQDGQNSQAPAGQPQK